MLQQTQVDRVVGPWRNFLDHYPTPRALAAAPLDEVLRAWAGLGYHRRARNLWRCAQEITERHDGDVPSDLDELRALRGVGPYTAAAVASFAFETRVAVLDTNVGRVLARCVANRRLTGPEATQLAHALLPRRDVARFNQAMLDLGATFCRARPRCATCPLARVCAWRRAGGEDPAPFSAGVSRAQPRFVGSRRQLRGQVLAALREGPATEATLRVAVDEGLRPDLSSVLDDLARDGLARVARGRWRLAEG
ncbi:MAG: A/G-specific adenine glycosylase [Acidobacteriota bacterium]|nr:A/G-specific adenine glycosylase [Acidobacteriota bacterium]MDE3222083.1 A/G-specific adenine glycosylase [Acidobacteriota bacterium]